MPVLNCPRLVRGFLFAALLLTILAAVPAARADSRAVSLDDDAVIDLARRYFEHLDKQRLDAARELMADAVEFEDPTWGAPAITDPNGILEAYSSTAGFSNILMNERMAFASNGTAVIHYVVSLSFTPPEDSPVKTPVPIVADLVRMAKVEDGRIVRHMDLAAYSVLKAALERAEGELADRE